MKRIAPVLLLLTLFPVAAMAGQDLGIADSILTAFKTNLQSFTSVGEAAGKSLFIYLLGFEIIRATYKKVLDGGFGDAGEISLWLLKTILVPLIFFGLLVKSQVLLQSILDTFVYLAKKGLPSGSASDTFSPSYLISIGIQTASQIPANAGLNGSTSWFTSPLLTLTALLAEIILLLAFAIMGAQMMMAYVEFYIVMTAAPIYIAFGALAFTRDWATKVFSHAVATGTKILVCGLLAMLMIKLGQDWSSILQTADFFKNPNQLLEIIGAGILLVLMAFFIPSVAAAIMSGNTSLGAGAAITSTMGAVAAATAATAAAVTAMGRGASAASNAAGGLMDKLAGMAPQPGSISNASFSPGGASGQMDTATGSGNTSGATAGDVGATSAPETPQQQMSREQGVFDKAFDSLNGGGSSTTATAAGDASSASIGAGDAEKKPSIFERATSATAGALNKGADMANQGREHVLDDRAQVGAHVDLKGG